MLVRLPALILSLASSSAMAATVQVTVRGPDGQPVKEAVVRIDTPRAPAGPIKFDWPYVMAQQNISFQPHVLIVPQGASVSFPNRDMVRHHVYSASKTKKFEIKLYGRDETRSEVFDKPGVVALGCNIHDVMSGFIYVTTSPFTAKTDANGHVTISNVPAGDVTLRVWYPSLRTPDNAIREAVSLPAGGINKTITLKAR